MLHNFQPFFGTGTYGTSKYCWKATKTLTNDEFGSNTTCQQKHLHGEFPAVDCSELRRENHLGWCLKTRRRWWDKLPVPQRVSLPDFWLPFFQIGFPIHHHGTTFASGSPPNRLPKGHESPGSNHPCHLVTTTSVRWHDVTNCSYFSDFS